MKNSYLSIFKNLIYVDLTIFKQLIISKIIDLAIWGLLTVYGMEYVLPFFGLEPHGVFQLASVIAGVGLFESYNNTIELVSDFEGERVIDQSLVLPVPSWIVIISKTTYYFCVYFILSITMLLLGKLCLWQQLKFAEVYLFKLLLIIIVQSAFTACFVTWAASLVINMRTLGKIFSRLIFPMRYFGGFQFSWIALHTTSPKLAYLNLLNPMTYLSEATRVAFLGQANYLDFWKCLCVPLAFCPLFLFFGIKNLKKKLDFI